MEEEIKKETKLTGGRTRVKTKGVPNVKPMITEKLTKYATCVIATGNVVGCALQSNVRYKDIVTWTNSPAVLLAVEIERSKNIGNNAGMDKQYLLSKLRHTIETTADEGDRLRAVSEVSKILGIGSEQDVQLPGTTEDKINRMIGILGEYVGKHPDDIKAFLFNKKEVLNEKSNE